MGDGRGVARGEAARPAPGRSPGPSAGRGRAGCASPSPGRERCPGALGAERQPGKHGGTARKSRCEVGCLLPAVRAEARRGEGGQSAVGSAGVLGGCGAECGSAGGMRGCGVRCAERCAECTGVRWAMRGCGAGLAATCRPGGRGRWPGPPPGSDADTGGLSCRMPRDGFGGRLRFSGQSPSRRAPGCATSACSEPSCAGWGAGVWWEEGKMKTNPTENAILGCPGKSP